MSGGRTNDPRYSLVNSSYMKHSRRTNRTISIYFTKHFPIALIR